MLAVDLERCRSLPLFSSMAPPAFQTMLAGLHSQPFHPSTMLAQEGNRSDLLYVLLRGQIELYATWNDQEISFNILEPGSTFTLSSIVLKSESLVSARTLGDCEILCIPGAAIRRAMVEDNAFAMAVAKELGHSFHALIHTVKNHRLRNGVERLADYLITLQMRNGGAHVVRLPHEKRILASLLAMTPENLSRAFAALQRQGFVIVRGPLITLTDRAALIALAKPQTMVDARAAGSGNMSAPTDPNNRAMQKSRGALTAA